MSPPGRLFTGQEIAELLLRACHDLRSPIRAIRAHTELLAKTTAGDPRLAFIVEGAGKLDQVVDGLAGYSLALRIDPGSFVAAPLGVLLRTALDKLGRQEVTCTGLPRVSGDPDRLMQLFENLLGHLLSISSRIHIAASRQDEAWLLTVRADGPDLVPAELERMFQPFSPGLGLGLAACREIVERHGGSIWAESQPDGCTVCFTLPAVP